MKDCNKFKDSFHLSNFNKSIDVTENQYMLLLEVSTNKGLELRELLDKIITDYMIRAYRPKNSLSHTHIWDNETPNQLYSHSHTRGNIPHGHHGSRYWKVEKPENYSQTLNPKSNQWVLIDKINSKILDHSDTQYKDIPIAQYK